MRDDRKIGEPKHVVVYSEECCSVVNERQDNKVENDIVGIVTVVILIMGCTYVNSIYFNHIVDKYIRTK